MTFRQIERARQLRWKAATRTLSETARMPGLYTGRRRQSAQRDEMFIHESHSSENLLPPHRDEALGMFRDLGISWHDGPEDGALPSNYLLDSMVSCVNCLMPFARNGRELAALLRPVVQGAIDADPIEDGRVIAFEWIGRENYLGEGPKRRRGAWGTSLDAHAVLVLDSGERVGVLMEWKYSEQNGDEEKKGAVRYERLWTAPDSPFDLSAVGGPSVLHYEPFYQLGRAQLLAAKMEAAGESGAERVVLLVVVPDANVDYRRKSFSPVLAKLVNSGNVEQAFRAMLRSPDRFTMTSFAALCRARLDGTAPGRVAGDEVWARYLEGR